MAKNFEPDECVILVQSTKIATQKNTAIHSIVLLYQQYGKVAVHHATCPWLFSTESKTLINHLWYIMKYYQIHGCHTTSKLEVDNLVKLSYALFWIYLIIVSSAKHSGT